MVTVAQLNTKSIKVGIIPINGSQSAMRADSIEIVFDRMPPSSKRLGYKLTTGVPYPATLTNRELGLYSLTDDNGTPFNVSSWGAGYINGGYWHIVGEVDYSD